MVAVPIYIPTNSVGGFLFLYTLSGIICRFFLIEIQLIYKVLF